MVARYRGTTTGTATQGHGVHSIWSAYSGRVFACLPGCRVLQRSLGEKDRGLHLVVEILVLVLVLVVVENIMMHASSCLSLAVGGLLLLPSYVPWAVALAYLACVVVLMCQFCVYERAMRAACCWQETGDRRLVACDGSSDQDRGTECEGPSMYDGLCASVPSLLDCFYLMLLALVPWAGDDMMSN
jgi:hypothetical protein